MARMERLGSADITIDSSIDHQSVDSDEALQRKAKEKVTTRIRNFVHPPPVQFTASEVRDHMANERTYLAWVRTALASGAFGIILMKLFPNQGSWAALAIGLVLVVQGGLFLLFAAYRYYRTLRLIEKVQFDPGKFVIALFSVFTFVCVVFVAVIVAVL